MGILWDLFKQGITVDEIEVCLHELSKIWDVFCSYIDCEISLRCIYLRRLRIDSYRVDLLKYGDMSNIWEFCIHYYRDDYECNFLAEYDMKKSCYVVKDGEDLSEEDSKKIKGYLFNSIKSISLLNNKVSDVIIKSQLFNYSTSVITLNTGRSIILHEGSIHVGYIGGVTRQSIEDYSGSYYKKLLSL